MTARKGENTLPEKLPVESCRGWKPSGDFKPATAGTRAASGQSLVLPIFQFHENAEPGRGLIQSNEVGNAGAQMHRGIVVPNVGFLAASFAALVPGVPPLGA
jgi:hypothetical protein